MSDRSTSQPKQRRSLKSLLPELVVILSLFTWLLLLRAPFFAIPTLDWDESTFIIVGQGILEGFLPYIKLWDFKPPFVFVFFAGAIAIFGKSIAAIRFAGCLWLAAASYLHFQCVLALTNNMLQSFAAAIFAATIVSLSTPYLSSELLALTPLIAAQLALLQNHEKLTKFYTCGLLIGIAGMFRANVVYVAIFVGMYVALVGFTHRNAKIAAARVAAYVAGGLTVIVIAAAPYAITQHLGLWFRSVFLVPWRFSTAGLSFFNISDLVIEALRMTYSSTPHVTGVFIAVALWFGGLLGMLFGLILRKRKLEPPQNNVFEILVFLGGIVASIFLTGTTHTHYIALAVPWFVMSASIAWKFVPKSCIRSIVSKGTLIVVLAHGIFSVAPVYLDLYNKLVKNEDIFSSPETEVAAFLRRENLEKQPIYLLDRHIVYWLVGQYPLTRMSTHPSNITKQVLIETIEGPKSTPEGEMEKILAVSPEFIIKSTKELWYLQSAPRASEVLTQALRRDYAFPRMMGEMLIYRKKRGIE
jgi:hypothetical protein